MIATVNPKGLTQVNFPIEIFGNEVSTSLKDLSKEYSVPINFFGASALWTIAALTGNMYRTELNGQVKSIIYLIMLGPSSLGKTVAYDKLCGDVLARYDASLRKDYTTKRKAWLEKFNAAKFNKEPFDEPEPHRIIRTITNGTLEAFLKYAETNPAGYGIYFDEGKALYSGGAHRKENSSVDFWNKAWNGKTFNEVRVDADRERFITNPAISILAGMQTERVNEMFSKDTIDSGLLNRFLFTTSDYVEINEEVDHFSEKKEICDEWKMLITKLYDDGCNFFDYDSQQKFIPFTAKAKALYNKVGQKNAKSSNELIKSIKKGDESEMFIGYNGKLHAYFGRFVLLCAIIKNCHKPVIDEECILNAEKIYLYFRHEAKKLIVKISDEQITSLNENEMRLLNTLPETFRFSDAVEISSQLKLSRSFFRLSFTRKFSKLGYMKQLQDGSYIKTLQ